MRYFSILFIRKVYLSTYGIVFVGPAIGSVGGLGRSLDQEDTHMTVSSQPYYHALSIFLSFLNKFVVYR